MHFYQDKLLSKITVSKKIIGSKLDSRYLELLVVQWLNLCFLYVKMPMYLQCCVPGCICQQEIDCLKDCFALSGEFPSIQKKCLFLNIWASVPWNLLKE